MRALRSTVQQVAADRGLAMGAAGTHPFAMWEDQRIVSRPRYRELVAGLQFVARQELIFGIHIHVGLDDPDILETTNFTPPVTAEQRDAWTAMWTRVKAE